MEKWKWVSLINCARDYIGVFAENQRMEKQHTAQIYKKLKNYLNKTLPISSSYISKGKKRFLSDPSRASILAGRGSTCL